MTTRRVTMTIEFDVDDEDELRPGRSFEDTVEDLRRDLEWDVSVDWPAENHKVSVEWSRDPTPPKSDTPGHLLNVLEVNNGLEHLPTCACGWKRGLDGEVAVVGFRSRDLARRVGDLHVFYVKRELEKVK